MNDIIFVVFLVIAGPILFSLGVWTLRSPAWHNRALAKVVTDHSAAGNHSPAPWHSRIALIQAWVAILIGTFCSLLLPLAISMLIFPE